MVISEELMQRSKDKAETILKTCIVQLALSLSVDLDTLDASYVIPVSESDIHYKSHLSLSRMCQSLESLQS